MREACWFTEAILGFQATGSATDRCHLAQISPVCIFFPSLLVVKASGYLLLFLYGQWSIRVCRSLNLAIQIYNTPVYINSPVTLSLLSKVKSNVYDLQKPCY